MRILAKDSVYVEDGGGATRGGVTVSGSALYLGRRTYAVWANKPGGYPVNTTEKITVATPGDGCGGGGFRCGRSGGCCRVSRMGCRIVGLMSLQSTQAAHIYRFFSQFGGPILSCYCP